MKENWDAMIKAAIVANDVGFQEEIVNRLRVEVLQGTELSPYSFTNLNLLGRSLPWLYVELANTIVSLDASRPKQRSARYIALSGLCREGYVEDVDRINPLFLQTLVQMLGDELDREGQFTLIIVFTRLHYISSVKEKGLFPGILAENKNAVEEIARLNRKQGNPFPLACLLVLLDMCEANKERVGEEASRVFFDYWRREGFSPDIKQRICRLLDPLDYYRHLTHKVRLPDDFLRCVFSR